VAELKRVKLWQIYSISSPLPYINISLWKNCPTKIHCNKWKYVSWFMLWSV